MKSGVERAAAAILEFNRIAPQLASYATALSGVPIQIKAGPTTETNGRTIYIRPPLSLGERGEHRQNKCDMRGKDWRQICSECARMEELYSNLYHEIAHVAYGSFGQLTSREIAQVAGQAAAAHGTPEFNAYIRSAASKILGATASNTTVPRFLNDLNEILLALFMGPEDGRIELLSAYERPGIGSMLYASTEILLTEGLENTDGTFSKWKDRHIEEQIPVAVLSVIKGHDLRGRFSDDVIRVMRHPPVAALLKRRMTNVTDAAYLSVGLLAQLHQLGLFDLPIPPPPPEEQDPDPSDEAEPEEQGDNDPGNEPGEDGDEDAANSSEQSGDSGDLDNSANDPEDGAENDSEENSDSDPLDGPEDNEGQESGEAVRERDSEADQSEDASGEADGESSPSNSASGGDYDPDASQSNATASDSDINGDELDSGGDSDNPDVSPDADADNGEAERDAEGFPSEAPLDFRDIEHLPSGNIVDAMSAAVGHDKDGNDPEEDEGATAYDFVAAINQCTYFDQVCAAMGTVKVFTAFRDSGAYAWGGKNTQLLHNSVPETVLGPSLGRARAVFSKSSKDTHERNLRSGKIDPRTLGGRAWQGNDDRLFHRRNVAEGISYEVVIGLDVSGSTQSGAISVIKQSGEAMASLLNRLNIPFSMYAHTTPRYMHQGADLHLYEIKPLKKKWNDEGKSKLAQLRPTGGSLDGHNLQFYRKILDRSTAKNRLCLYFTDGQIPATNPDEEGPMMRKEVKTMELHGHKILGVGVGTDSPKNYGLDTVAISSGRDIVTLVKALEERLTGNHRS